MDQARLFLVIELIDLFVDVVERGSSKQARHLSLFVVILVLVFESEEAERLIYNTFE